MRNFGEILRDLRVARNLGLRETATKAGISPAYLSRIERGKENPPRPEVIRELAVILAADPDVLFRLSSSTDPAVVNYLHGRPDVMNLVRIIMAADLTEEGIKKITTKAKNLSKQS